MNKSNGNDERFMLTRRQFGAAVGGAALLTAAGLRMDEARAAETPKRGGIVRVGMHSQSTNDTFDSAKFTFSNDYIRGTCFYNTLTVPGVDLKPQPSLAESWEPSDGGKRWVFKIVKGVKFHDGSPLTFDDIAFSILRHKDEALGSVAKGLSENIVDVTELGPDTIAIDLARPNADFPIIIGTFQYMIVKNGTTDFSKPNGTGPFKLKEFNPGVLTSGERNPDYWREGRPYVDGFEMRYIVDPVARVNALLAGDVDMISDVKGTGVDEVENSPNTTLLKAPSARYTVMQSSIDMSPMDNHDLRLAMNYLIDRDRVLKTVLKGNGAIANDHPFMSTSEYYNSALEQRSLDHDRAKYHLKRAGIGTRAVDLHVSEATPFSIDIGQMMQREASLAGLNINLRREPADSYFNTICGKRPFYANGLNPRPSYSMLLGLTWKSNVPWNYSRYNSADLDTLIDRSGATLDEAERTEIFHDIQKIIYDVGCYTVPCFINFVDGISKKVKGLEPVPLGNLNGFNFADNVWLD